MDIDDTLRKIRALYQTLSGKSDNDVLITFKGNNYGVSKPYNIKIDAREASHETFEGSLLSLLSALKMELSTKISTTESEVKRLRQTLTQMDS